ncbi:MAG: PTS sugar transporter subunit IIA [Treponemataceae bacterium]
MNSKLDINELIQRGGILSDIEGSDITEIFKKISQEIPLPPYIDRNVLYEELCKREQVMSTGIGAGIAIPHTKFPLMKSKNDQQITVCYLKNPIDVGAPDKKPVTVMFVLLTFTQQDHLSIISQLAFLLQNNSKIKTLLKKEPSLDKLQEEINAFL